jgi:hypothetical protein
MLMVRMELSAKTLVARKTPPRRSNAVAGTVDKISRVLELNNKESAAIPVAAAPKPSFKKVCTPVEAVARSNSALVLNSIGLIAAAEIKMAATIHGTMPRDGGPKAPTPKFS